MNEQIFYFLNNFAFQYDWLDSFIVFCAQWLPFWLVGIFIIFTASKVFCPKHRNTWRDEPLWKEVTRKILVVLGATFSVWGVSQIINYFYYSPRPFLVLDDLNLLFIHGDIDSFPSGHATFFFSLAFISYYYSPKWLFSLLLSGAIFISIARVVSGVHWPADILGAFLLSLIGIFILQKLITRIFYRE